MTFLAELEALGYDIILLGDDLKLTYHREGNPDPAQVIPLLETIKVHKHELVEYLKRQASFEAIFKQALEEINRTYPSGLIAHLKGNCPEVWQKALILEDGIEKAWLEADKEAMERVCKEYISLFSVAVTEYLRPEAETESDQESLPFHEKGE